MTGAIRTTSHQGVSGPQSQALTDHAGMGLAAGSLA